MIKYHLIQQRIHFDKKSKGEVSSSKLISNKKNIELAFGEHLDITSDGEKIFNPYKGSPVHIVESKNIKNINPSLIIPPKIDENFWNHHGYSKEKYFSFAKDYIKARTIIKNGGELDINSRLAVVYSNFESTSEPVKLIEFNGCYILDGAGRHRVALAKIFNIPLNAYVTKYEEKESELKINSTNP